MRNLGDARSRKTHGVHSKSMPYLFSPSLLQHLCMPFLPPCHLLCLLPPHPASPPPPLSFRLLVTFLCVCLCLFLSQSICHQSVCKSVSVSLSSCVHVCAVCVSVFCGSAPPPFSLSFMCTQMHVRTNTFLTKESQLSYRHCVMYFGLPVSASFLA